jgi:hypothetical protein
LLLLHPRPATIIKSASVSEPEVFADNAAHRYPCDTAADTWLSTLFFLDKRSHYPAEQAAHIDEQLQTAARFFSIDVEVDDLRHKFAKAAESGDTSPVDYVFSWTDDSGVKQNHWSLRNAEEVKLAAGGLVHNRDRIHDFATRKDAARKAIRAAARYELDLPEKAQLCKMAAHGTCDSATLVAAVRQRALITGRKDPEFAAELEKLATHILMKPSTSRLPENLEKLAETLDNVDTTYNIRGDTGYPEDELFRITLDDVNSVKQSYTQFPTGTVYSKADLERLPANLIQEWLGDSTAKQATIAGLFTVDADTLASVISGLPSDQQELFDKMAAAAGISPALRPEDLEQPLPMSRQALAGLL